MRQLFLRIFLSVLSTVLFTFAIGLVMAFWLIPRPAPPPPARQSSAAGPQNHRRERMHDVLVLHARVLSEVMSEQGPAEVLRQAERLAATWDCQTFLIDEHGDDLQNREVPPSAGRLARQARELDGPQFREEDHAVIMAMRMHPADGSTYVFIAATTPRDAPGRPPLARLILLRLSPIAVGLGLVCYLLARHIAAPIVTLRSALRGFAQGRLDQRVGPTIGERRDEIGELARDFDEMAERIATLLGAQSRLLRDISHELRSPLARQRVALELVRQRDGVDAVAALDRVEREAERLDEMIGELLTLTRLESDTDNAVRSVVQLDQLVRETIENAEFEACNGNRSVRLVRCSPCATFGVTELLRRAVENIVRNALAYTADGTAVEVALHEEASEAVIRVRDHGPGVPENQLTDIFRPFYRVSRGRERETGGAGLGLAIVARAVHSHGGSVVATNHPEGGLVIEMRLPRDSRTDA